MKYALAVKQRLFQKLDRRRLLKFCVIAGMLIGLFTHGFMFANKIPNHDEHVQYVHQWAPTAEERAIVQAMLCYPAAGSIAFIDGLCVVRFS